MAVMWQVSTLPGRANRATLRLICGRERCRWRYSRDWRVLKTFTVLERRFCPVLLDSIDQSSRRGDKTGPTHHS